MSTVRVPRRELASRAEPSIHASRPPQRVHTANKIGPDICFRYDRCAHLSTYGQCKVEEAGEDIMIVGTVGVVDADAAVISGYEAVRAGETATLSVKAPAMPHEFPVASRFQQTHRILRVLSDRGQGQQRNTHPRHHRSRLRGDHQCIRRGQGRLCRFACTLRAWWSFARSHPLILNRADGFSRAPTDMGSWLPCSTGCDVRAHDCR